MTRSDKTHSIRACLLRTACWGAALALTSPLAQAIVSYDEAHQTSGVGVSALNGVAKVSITDSQGTGICSGSLVGGGAYVLTAAHCFTVDGARASPASEVTVAFKQDTVNVGASAVYVNPMWRGYGGSLGDLALIKLSSPLTGIASYALDYGNAQGSQVLIAGYGLTGTGAGGVNPAAWTGALFYGRNQYDDPHPLTGYYGYDFDDGTAAHSVFGSLGLGTQEASAAEGDSGGPNLVLINGAWMLAGVTSWGSTQDVKFGSYEGSTSIAFNAAWLQSYLAAAVPEPENWVLLMSGLPLVLACSRRGMRRRNT